MFCELNVWNDIKSIKNTINDPPEQRKDFIAEIQRELLRIVIVTTKEPQAFLPSVNECKNINEVDDPCNKLSYMQDRLQVIADNETDVFKRMKGLLRKN